MKRELEKIPNYSTFQAFQIMDIKKYNYLDWESMYIFLKFSGGAPNKKKMCAIF